MSKIVTLCFRDRNPEQMANRRRELQRFLATLKPDNLEPAPSYLSDDAAGCITAVFNPSGPEATHRTSAYAGWVKNAAEDWWRPGTPAPEGSYGLIRCNDDTVELVADALASRTIWYAQTDSIFVASTSQRAITWFIRGFELDRESVAWMLSSGVLGPQKSWNRKVSAVPGAGTVRLDRSRWTLQVSSPRIEYREDPVDFATHESRLRGALDLICGDLGLDFGRWAFPLSGGNDSRAILLSMANRQGLQCVTWGLREALSQPGTDATVAREVAHKLHLTHAYFETDLASQNAQTVLARFLNAGEGRNDHLSGYADGFNLWRRLAGEGIKGIIRGDHPFGAKAVDTADEARFRSNVMLWSDFNEHPALATFGLPDLEMQSLPDALAQRNGESNEDWRDRLFQQFRAPAVYASLTELKSPYVEIANPLLCSRLVQLARTHPAALRTAKALFRAVVKERDIGVPYANAQSIQESAVLFDSPEIKTIVLDEVGSQSFRTRLSPGFSDYLLNSVSASSGSTARLMTIRRVRRNIKRMLPTLTKKIKVKPNWRALPTAQLALRAYLVGKMATRFEHDARAAS